MGCSVYSSGVANTPTERTDGDKPDEELTCPTCGTTVPEGSRSCPVCHRGVLRTCFCGWQLPANERICPNCGADWSQSKRVARKSRSRTPRRSGILRYALIGSVSGLAAVVVAYALITGFALLGTEGGRDLPVALGSRMALAIEGAARLMHFAGRVLLRYVVPVLLLLLILGVGAAAGVGVYLLKVRAPRKPSRRPARRERRKRRK